MRISLAIHLCMLALAGGLAWHVDGSPFLPAASLVVVMMYALLSFRPGRVEGITRIISSALMVVFCPMYYGKDPGVLLVCLLGLVQLWSVTQCIWEIQCAGVAKRGNTIGAGRGIFTLGFYATQGLAFLLLRADLLNMDRSFGITLAIVVSLLGLIAWETGRVSDLRKGVDTNVPSVHGMVGRVTLMGLGALVFALLFAVVLPLASDVLCGFSPDRKPSRQVSDPVDLETSAAETGVSIRTRSSEEPDAAPEKERRMVLSGLSLRGTLDLSDKVDVVVRFGNAAQEEALLREGPLYLRTLSLCRFGGSGWTSETPSGRWAWDADDGRADGRVDVGKPSPGDILHEVFLPQNKGHALPALAGVTSYGLPELFVRPDNWYQSAVRGDIRYKAWSRPVNILSLDGAGLEAGNPGEIYLTRLSTPFGERLTETAGTFMTRRTDLAGRLALLQQYFQTEFRYSTTVENLSGLPPLENFIYQEKRGYCDFFASAAALMLRHMGIPSRVAYGYKDGERDAANGTWIFRGFHAHAWTEIFVKDHGWVICDFTPPSANISPRSATPPPFDMAKFKNAMMLGGDDENRLWNKSQSLQSLRSLWVPAILGLGLLAAMVVFLFRKQQQGPWQWKTGKSARVRTGTDKQPAYFLEFLRMCEAHGHTRMKGQTLMEFHRYLKRCEFCADHFDDLVDHYYKTRYENAARDERGEHRFLQRIREFGKTRSMRPTEGH